MPLFRFVLYIKAVEKRWNISSGYWKTCQSFLQLRYLRIYCQNRCLIIERRTAIIIEIFFYFKRTKNI